MKPEIKTNYPVLDLIKNRWSPRAFSDKKIPTGEILSLFESARWAASSRNGQPWYFIYASKGDGDIYDQLFECMVEWNQSWAKTADVLILAIAQTVSGKHPHPGALYDLGLAVGNLTTQASSEGIYLHQMGGLDFDKIQANFELPENHEAVAMIAAGYPGNLDGIPADIAEGEHHPQERKPQEEFVFNSKPTW